MLLVSVGSVVDPPRLDPPLHAPAVRTASHLAPLQGAPGGG